MSLKRHTNAKLGGTYSGPYFPRATDELNRLLAVNAEADGAFLQHVAQQIPYFDRKLQGTVRLRTSDGYQWFKALPFAIGGEKDIALIMIPFRNDRSRRDGSASDRSVATYTKD